MITNHMAPSSKQRRLNVGRNIDADQYYPASMHCRTSLGAPAKRHLMAFRWLADGGSLWRCFNDVFARRMGLLFFLHQSPDTNIVRWTSMKLRDLNSASTFIYCYWHVIVYTELQLVACWEIRYGLVVCWFFYLIVFNIFSRKIVSWISSEFQNAWIQISPDTCLAWCVFKLFAKIISRRQKQA